MAEKSKRMLSNPGQMLNYQELTGKIGKRGPVAGNIANWCDIANAATLFRPEEDTIRIVR